MDPKMKMLIPWHPLDLPSNHKARDFSKCTQCGANPQVPPGIRQKLRVKQPVFMMECGGLKWVAGLAEAWQPLATGTIWPSRTDGRTRWASSWPSERTQPSQ